VIPTHITFSAPAGPPPSRRIVGDLLAWPLAAIAVGMWLGVTAAVIEGLRDSTFAAATIGRDLGDAIEASTITALIPGTLIGFVFALLFVPTGFAAFGVWQAVRHARNQTARRWLASATIGVFCLPVVLGTVAVNAFSPLDSTEWGVGLLGVLMSVAAAAGISYLRRPRN
jgi:tetrahydromethanopterin S-methyltransferase subunit F